MNDERFSCEETIVLREDGTRKIKYSFAIGLVIEGRVQPDNENHFCLDEMYYVKKRLRNKGYGTQALKVLKSKYQTISVHEITEYAYGFWVKMYNKGLVTSLDSFF